MNNAQQSILGLGENLAVADCRYSPLAEARLLIERAHTVETCLRKERDDAKGQLGDIKTQLAVSHTICNDLRNSVFHLHNEMEELSREKDLITQQLVHTEDLLRHDGALVTQLRNDLSIALNMIAGYAFQAQQFDAILQEAEVTINLQDFVIFDQGIYILGLRQAIAQGLAG